MSDRYYLQVIDVQTNGVKVYGPLTDRLALDCVTKLLKDQPLAMVHDAPRVWVVNLETGEITKPILKLQI